MDTVAIIITDCIFLESEISVLQWKHDMEEYACVKYDSIFNYQGINKEIFVENMKYYFSKTKYAEKLINKVDEMVEQRVAALRDSLNNTQ